MGTLTSLLLVLLFVLIGGLFAGTEMAIVSLREAQIRDFESSGRRGRRIARLVRNPNQFLAAVQIGVTVAGFFSASYGASAVAPALMPVLESWGVAPDAAGPIALVALTLVIAYLSLVLGELAPKRLAMQRAVAMTRIVAPPLAVFAAVMRPVIWLLSASTDLVVRLAGGDPRAYTQAVSAEEIRSMVSTSDQIQASHRRILADVFSAAERTVEEVMRPRPQVDFLDGSHTVAQALVDAGALPYSRYPVFGRDADDVLGFVHIRDLAATADRERTTIAQLARPIAALPGTVKVLPALSRMRASGDQIALVIDEYGGTDGIVTLEDLLEEVVGDIYDEFDVGREPEDTVRRTRESVGVDGGLILQEFRDQTGIELPDLGGYETVGGFILSRLGHIPAVGEAIAFGSVRLTVTEMDGRRIARVRVDRRGRGGAADGDRQPGRQRREPPPGGPAAPTG